MSSDPYTAALGHCTTLPTNLQVVRHPKRRRVGLYRTDGALQLRIPARLSVRRWQDWIATHHDWLQRSANAMLQQMPLAAPLAFTSDSQLPIEGHLRPLLFRTTRQQHLVARVQPFHIEVCGAQVHAAPAIALQRSIHAAYRRAALIRWTPRVHAGAVQLGVVVQRIRLSDPATRWGSCSTRGTISLSWRLFAAPRWVADYVIWHELCHLRHMDHSKQFWALLDTCTPHVTAARAWLRCCGHALRHAVGG